MLNKGSSIKSSQPRGMPVNHTVVNGFAPQNGYGEGKPKDNAGKSTKKIEKSSSQEQAGPKTNNL